MKIICLNKKSNFFLISYYFFNKQDLYKNNNIVFKNNFKDLKKFNILNKLILISIKNGLKQKILNFFLKVLKIFFFLFYKNFFSLFSKNFHFYNLIISFFKSLLLFNNINFLLKWVVLFLKPVFSLKCEKISKKLKKKLKKKYNFKINYIYPNKRESVAIHWIYLNIANFNGKNFIDKLLKSLIDIFINGKNSKIFYKKVYILGKLSKKKI